MNKSFFFIKLFFSRRNIFLCLSDFNNNIVLFRSIKYFLKIKNIKKLFSRRYPFKLLSDFFIYFLNLIAKLHKHNFFYILFFYKDKNFFNRLFLNLYKRYYSFLSL